MMSPEPLEYLEEFSKEVLDVRSHANQHQLHVLQTNLPAIWPDLDEMCTLENSVFLPREVSTIILTLSCSVMTNHDQALSLSGITI